MYDYSEHRDEVKPGDNAMARLAGLAHEQRQAELRVAKIQEELQKAQDELNRISQKELPELMAELRLETFRTEDGIKIEVSETVHTSIPKPRHDEAMNWLDQTKNSGIIKREFTISFGRDDDKWAEKFKQDLARRKKPLNAKVQRRVEPSTLKAFVTRALEAGENIPQDLFGVFRRRVTKVEVDTK